jgi:desulfoferrodoxin (superoxide reductase-like protein)
MTRRKTCFIALGLLVAVLWGTSAEANPPKKVTAEYTASTRTLSVTIEHPVWIRWLHHIKSVEIRLNGKLLETVWYDTQPGDTFTYTYQVTASPGDVIEATAHCNLYGSRTARLPVPKP